MNTVRRIFGVIWMLLAVASLYFIVSSALSAFDSASAKIATATTDAMKIAAEAAKTNTILQWSIIIIIYLPIAFGLIVFGKYALAGEYDRNKQLA